MRNQQQRRRAVLRSAICEALEQRRLLAADVVISEFLASNGTGKTDSYGQHSDWIELHNAGDAAANLNNFFLTDSTKNLELYRLPNQTLAAGASVIVFASGDNTVTSGGEIHTNFNLSSDGEYLALVNAADDSIQFQYGPTYPPQTTDVSYGLLNFNDPNSAQGYFRTPTPPDTSPNATNPTGINQPSAVSPTFSVSSKSFTSSFFVKLATTTPGATIYYTVNGQSPTTSSSVYSASMNSGQGILVSTTTILRAMAYNPALDRTANSLQSESPASSQSYILLGGSVSGFNSNLPIVLINSFTSTSQISDDTTISQTSDTGAAVSFIDTTGGTANITDTPNYIGRAGIHVRGSTSSGILYTKKQYSVELWDDQNGDKKQSILGMPADSDWVLYAPYTEKSMMQNALAYQWANEMGEYASKTRFVEVYLNTQNSNGSVGSTNPGGLAPAMSTATYAGVYILEEKIKISSSRVNVDEITPTNLDGGYVVAEDRNDSGTESNFSTNGLVHYIVNVDPDVHSISTTTPPGSVSEFTQIKNDWNYFEANLSSSNFASFIDVQSWVDAYLLNEMTKNIDSFWLSTYFTKTAGTGLVGGHGVGGGTATGLIEAGPAWDFNLAMGAANYNGSSNSDGWDTDTLTPNNPNADNGGFPSQDPYFQKLLTFPDFKQAVVDRWAQLRSTVFTTGKLMQDIDTNVSILANGTTNYPGMVSAAVEATNPVGRNAIRWGVEGAYIVTDGYFDTNGIWQTNSSSTNPNAGDINMMKNWLTARLNWMDTETYYVDPKPADWTTYPPATTEAPPEPSVTTGGTFGAPVTVSMSGTGNAMKNDSVLMSDGYTMPATTPVPTVKYQVPTSATWSSSWVSSTFTTDSTWTTSLGMGVGYDNKSTPTFLPYIGTGATSGNTQASSTSSAMVGKATTVLARYTFTVTPAQVSALGALILEMRYDDGYTAWIDGVRVADVNSKQNTDFLNSTNSPWSQASDGSTSGVDAAAITLRDYDISSFKGLLTAGTHTLAIQEWNSGNNSSDALVDPAIVSRTYSYPSGATVYYTTNGTDPRPSGGGSSTAPLYSAPFSITTSTKIEARTYVGGIWGALNTQTYQIGTDPLRITELQYDPSDNANNEFIKVKNIGTSTLSLSGYAFTNGITFTFPTTGPTSMLAAGASGVIVKDPTLFAARYGSQFNVLGTYTGSLDNSGETITLQNGFGTSVQSFKYNSDSIWYPDTHGGGSSLAIIDPNGALANWGLASGWQDSLADSPPVVANTSAGANSSFNVDVTFMQTLSSTTSLSTMVLTNTTTSTTINNATITPHISGTDLLLSFSGLSNGILPDGYYLATLPNKGVATASGVPLAASYSFVFFVLSADANHDANVNALDFNALATNYGKSVTSIGLGDFDYNGTVDSNDFSMLASRFGTHLAPPGGADVPDAMPANALPLSLAAQPTSLFSDKTIADDGALLDDVL